MPIFFILNIYCIQPNITIPSESNKHFLEKKKEKNAKKIAIFLCAPNKDALLLAKKKRYHYRLCMKKRAAMQ